MRDGLHLGGPGHYGTFPIRRRNSRGKACTLVVQDIMVLSKYEGDVHERWLAPWWSRTLWYFQACTLVVQDIMVLSQYEGDVHERWLAPWWSRTLWYFPNTKEKFMRDGLHLGGPGHYGTFTIRRRYS